MVYSKPLCRPKLGFRLIQVTSNLFEQKMIFCDLEPS